jgi:hypothetical protein
VKRDRKVTKVTCGNLGRTLGLAIFGLTDFIHKPSAPFFFEQPFLSVDSLCACAPIPLRFLLRLLIAAIENDLTN